MNLGQTREFNEQPPSDESDNFNNTANQSKGNISLSMMSSGSKLWTTINIPHTYMGSSWPIRFTSLDSECQYLAVAGRTGLAHYSVLTRKWRLFGNETQEKDFIVTGGLLWWKDFIIVGCYNLAALHDEVRIYPRNEKLDNANAKMFKVDTQVLLLNLLNDLLVVFCADNQITVFNLDGGHDGKASSLSIERVRTFDVNNIPGLSFHPACVILVALTNLKTETLRSGNRDSVSRDSPTNEVSKPGSDSSPPSIILNICGRVVMIQTEATGSGEQGAEQGQQMVCIKVLKAIYSLNDPLFPDASNRSGVLLRDDLVPAAHGPREASPDCVALALLRRARDEGLAARLPEGGRPRAHVHVKEDHAAFSHRQTVSASNSL